jgi:hypothetical protein
VKNKVNLDYASLQIRCFKPKIINFDEFGIEEMTVWSDIIRPVWVSVPVNREYLHE